MKIVQDNKSLKTLCKNLKNQKIIYLDTEFIRDRTYWNIQGLRAQNPQELGLCTREELSKIILKHSENQKN